MQVNFVEANPMPVKAAMAAMGLLEEVYRLPMVPPQAGVEGKDRQGAASELGLLKGGACLACSKPTSRTLVAAGAVADRDAARAVFARLREALSAGEVRAAEPDASSADRLARQHLGEAGHPARLQVRRHRRRVDGPRPLPFYDKDTLPLKKPGLAAGIRIVPGGSAIRDGAYLAPGVICMPPMYVNIGAWVGEGSMIDSHALVGSCAQVGARVHVSAGAQIGGVIEPVGALPVIIEDDALIGGNTGIYEGAVDQGARGDRGRHGADRIDAGLRSRARRDHQADGRSSARRSPKAPSSCPVRAR